MPFATLLASQTLAILAMIAMPGLAPERRIEIPLDPAGGLPVAEVVAALAQASGAAVERPAVSLTLPTRGLGGSLARTLLGECLGTGVAFVFRPGVVVMVVDEQSLGADRRDEWKQRLEDLATRSLQASKRHQYYGMSAMASYRPNDPARPTVCLVHGINSSSGGFVHMIRPLEQAGLRDRGLRLSLQPAAREFVRPVPQGLASVPERGWREAPVGDPGPLDGRRSWPGRTSRVQAAPSSDVSSLILIAPVNQGSTLRPDRSPSTRRSPASLRSTASGPARPWRSSPTGSARPRKTCCPAALPEAAEQRAAAGRGPVSHPGGRRWLPLARPAAAGEAQLERRVEEYRSARHVLAGGEPRAPPAARRG